MTMKKMGVVKKGFVCTLFVSLFLCVSVFRVDVAVADDTANECNDSFQKVMICLDYAKGKTATPSKECCSSIKDIKDSKPKCLCYIIQQTHGGTEALKSLGVQEGKLLQLPTACELKNASISDCPKLLGLSPSDPDAAIFTNASSTPTPTTTTGTASPETADSTSNGAMLGPYLVGPILAAAMLIFFNAFATDSGSASAFMFYKWV